MKRHWIFGVLMAGVLALGVTGGIALAHGGGNNDGPPGKSFVSRVAAILGQEETQVQNAFNQAHQAAAGSDQETVADIEKCVDELAAEMWGLTKAELKEIQESLAELTS